jgi:ABC-type multidrug transport system fused ATPase/permease subunit
MREMIRVSTLDRSAHSGPPSRETTATDLTADKAPELADDEDRNVGGIPWSVYTGYVRAMGNPLWALAIISFLTLGQVANVGNSLMLGLWSGMSISGWGQNLYMAVYASLGLAMALCIVSRPPCWLMQFASMYTMNLGGLRASYDLFSRAWHAVMHTSVAWHDRTPVGLLGDA